MIEIETRGDDPSEEKYTGIITFTSVGDSKAVTASVSLSHFIWIEDEEPTKEDIEQMPAAFRIVNDIMSSLPIQSHPPQPDYADGAAAASSLLESLGISFPKEDDESPST